MTKLFNTAEELEAYEKGREDGTYGFTYINPSWTKAELNAWGKGYKETRKSA